MVPVGLAGLAISRPESGERACAASSMSPVITHGIYGRGLDQHRFAAERSQDVAIRRISGTRDRDPIAELEHRQGKRESKSSRRAGGDDDAFRRHGNAVESLGVVPRDALPQRTEDTERLRVAQRTRVALPGPQRLPPSAPGPPAGPPPCKSRARRPPRCAPPPPSRPSP